MIEALPLLAWPLQRRLLTILIYHRVLPAPDPYRPGEVWAELFDRQMAFVKRRFAVLPLPAAAAALAAGTLPRRSCCITFDDGYADNLTIALPILERHRLPATVFVATGYLDGGRMFNDSAIEILARARGPQLDLSELGLGCRPLPGPAERLALLPLLLERLKYLAPEPRARAVAEIAERAGGIELPDDLMLSSAQVAELSRRGVDIGGHTVAHTILTTLDDDRAQRELTENKRHLETLTGRPALSFAYPNGRPDRDYAAHHIAMVKELGYRAAVSTAYGIAGRGSDPWQLPRVPLWGTSIPRLAARLTRLAWFHPAAATAGGH